MPIDPAHWSIRGRRREVTPDPPPPAAPPVVCRRCLDPVGGAAHVVLADSNVVHLACYVSTGDAIDGVARFLQACEERRVCHTCLSAALRLRFEDARRATGLLRLSPRFRIEIAACALCGAERVTVRAAAPDTPPRPSLSRLDARTA